MIAEKFFESEFNRLHTLLKFPMMDSPYYTQIQNLFSKRTPSDLTKVVNHFIAEYRGFVAPTLKEWKEAIFLNCKDIVQDGYKAPDPMTAKEQEASKEACRRTIAMLSELEKTAPPIGKSLPPSAHELRLQQSKEMVANRHKRIEENLKAGRVQHRMTGNWVHKTEIQPNEIYDTYQWYIDKVRREKAGLGHIGKIIQS